MCGGGGGGGCDVVKSEEVIKACKQRIELVATTLGLQGFARIDAFVHADSGEVILILSLM